MKMKPMSQINKETDPWFPLVRIAEALEEILRLVKKDQEDSASRQRQWDEEKK